MEIAVDPKLRRFLQQKIREGRFKSPSQAVNFALATLQEQERKVKWLRRELKKGIDSLDRGEGRPWNLQEQQARVLERWSRRGKRANASRRYVGRFSGGSRRDR
jgi:putative addiction module CopG family antidote